jgi:hypothetical protein
VRIYQLNLLKSIFVVCSMRTAFRSVNDFKRMADIFQRSYLNTDDVMSKWNDSTVEVVVNSNDSKNTDTQQKNI